MPMREHAASSFDRPPWMVSRPLSSLTGAAVTSSSHFVVRMLQMQILTANFLRRDRRIARFSGRFVAIACLFAPVLACAHAMNQLQTCAEQMAAVDESFGELASQSQRLIYVEELAA